MPVINSKTVKEKKEIDARLIRQMIKKKETLKRRHLTKKSKARRKMVVRRLFIQRRSRK